MSELNPLLEVRDLRVEIPTRRGTVRPVDGVSFTAAPGMAAGLVGESGSGKSMTLRAALQILPGQARIAGGEIWFDGVDLTTLSASQVRAIRGRRIAMVFQEPMSALNPVMRVGEQIAEGPRAHLGLSRAQARDRAIELMRAVGIPDAESRLRAYPHEFSGGMRQRVMIAIALSSEPELILCDEPTTALDVTIQDQILKLLVGLCVDRGVGLVLVTHDLAVVAQTCQTVSVMYAGQVVESGTVEEIFRRPRHPYTRALLRSAPTFEQARASLESIDGSPPDLAALPTGCRFHPRCVLAQEDCREGAFPLQVVSPGHSSRCIHHDLLAQLDPSTVTVADE